MCKYKICSIFMVWLLVQTALGESVDSYDKESAHLTSKQRFLKYVITNLLTTLQDYTKKSLKLTHEILQDEEFRLHQEPLVEEFKNNLTKFVEAYESSTDVQYKLHALNLFFNTTDFYYEIPEDELTPESKYIVEVLNKYHYRDIDNEMEKKFAPFEKNFKKMFEEFKNEWDENALDWFEKYQNIDDFKARFNAFITLKIF